MPRVGRWLPVLLWAGVTLLLAGRLGSASTTGSFLLPTLQGWGLSDAAALAVHVGLRKAGHALAYAAFTALAWRALQGQRRQVVLALGLALLLAVLDEALQATSPWREGAWTDVLLDGVAAALAVLLLSRRRAVRAAAAAGAAGAATLSPPGA